VRDETIRSIRSEPSIGELILPLDVKGPPPEVVFALDLDSDSLLHALLLPLAEETYISRDLMSNRCYKAEHH